MIRHAAVVAAIAALTVPAPGDATQPPVPHGLVRLAPTPRAREASDLVGVNLQAAGGAVPARVVRFGQVFAAGTLPAGAALSAATGGRALPAQLDVKTHWPDGSVKMAVVSIAAPAVPARGSLPVMLGHGAATAAQVTPVDLGAALARTPLTVSIGLNGGEIRTIDAGAALRTALAAGRASGWQSGPVVSETRVMLPIAGAFRLVLDLGATADGAVIADVQFDNDIAMGPAGGAVRLDETVTLGGRIVSHQTGIAQAQYQDWDVAVASDDIDPDTVNVQHDIAYLEATGTIPQYDLATGVDGSLIAEAAKAMASPSWDRPLDSRGVTQFMPMTGGRSDLGPTTQANTVWLMTQDPIAARYAIEQEAAAGAVPWNFFDAGHGVWLNTDAFPRVWIDGRGGNGPPGGLTQQISDKTGWATDPAHQPDLSFIPYLLTGRHVFLDRLTAQASFSVVDQWPGTRVVDGMVDNVVNGNQTRGAAWDLRQIDEAGWANPDVSAEAAYYRRVGRDNFTWMNAQTPAWTTQQGESHGWFPGVYGSDGRGAPWEEDYLAFATIQAIDFAVPGARAYLDWSQNFLVGRFQAGAAGFNPRDGIAYNVLFGNGHTLYRSWREIGQATAAANQSNGSGWKSSQGDYGQLALQTLAGIYNATGSADALRAYDWLRSADAPFTSAADFARDPSFNIVPRRPGAEPAARPSASPSAPRPPR